MKGQYEETWRLQVSEQRFVTTSSPYLILPEVRQNKNSPACAPMKVFPEILEQEGYSMLNRLIP